MCAPLVPRSKAVNGKVDLPGVTKQGHGQWKGDRADVAIINFTTNYFIHHNTSSSSSSIVEFYRSSSSSQCNNINETNIFTIIFHYIILCGPCPITQDYSYGTSTHPHNGIGSIPQHSVEIRVSIDPFHACSS